MSATTRLRRGSTSRPGQPDHLMHRSEWRAMGCHAEIELIGAAPDGPSLQALAGEAVALVAQLEARWSRFLVDSDISRLNRAHGRPVGVAAETIDLLEAMGSAAGATGGAFDPTLLAPLVGLGYATSWSPGRDPSPTPDAAWAGRGSTVRGRTALASIEIDRARRTVTLPDGMLLDAGGIGKGQAADLTADLMLRRGATTVMVGLGGDLRIAGQPLPAGWPVNIAHPHGGEPIATLAIGSGGVATSGTTWRRWATTDPTGRTASAHHLLDPRSGRPTPDGPGDVIQATVVAGTASWAEAFATQAVVDGTACLDDLDRRHLGALVVLGDGSVHHNHTWAVFNDGGDR